MADTTDVKGCISEPVQAHTLETGLRKVEVLRGDEWVEVPSLVDVKKGERFQMSEPIDAPEGVAGELVGIFVATDDGFINKNGIATIMCEDAPAGLGEEIIVADEDTMTLIDMATGEVKGVMDTPPEDASAIDIATWVGDRRDWHRGKLAGLRAEKQSRIDAINNAYDSQMKRHEGTIKWLEYTYKPMLFDLARKLIGEAKKRSTVVGLLILKIKSTRASLDVVDNDAAVAYLRSLIEENKAKQATLIKKMNKAQEEDESDTFDVLEEKVGEITQQISVLESCINIKETVYKSQVPPDLKDELTEDKLVETGMQFNKGGEEYLEIE
jgi:hypothetical protein